MKGDALKEAGPQITTLRNVKQTALILGISPRLLHDLAKEGKIGSVRPTPNVLRFSDAQIAEFIAVNSVKAR